MGVLILEAWASAPLRSTSRNEADAWFARSFELVPDLFPELAGQRVSLGGWYSDDAAGVERHTRGLVLPSEAGLSFGPGLTYSTSAHVGPETAWGPPSEDVEDNRPPGGLAHAAANLWGKGDHLDLTLSAACVVSDVNVVAEVLSRHLQDHCAVWSASFGNVAPDNSPGRTRLEQSLGRPSELGRTEAADLLRGYAWRTIVPGPLARGIQSRVEDAGLESAPLAHGSMLVGAPGSVREYHPRMTARVFESLAPVLPPGKPRIFRDPSGEYPKWLDPRDARDIRGW